MIHKRSKPIVIHKRSQTSQERFFEKHKCSIAAPAAVAGLLCLSSPWPSPCTRLALHSVVTKGTLQTATHAMQRRFSYTQFANNENDAAKCGDESYLVHKPSPCTRLGLHSVLTKGTLQTATHPRQRPFSCAQFANNKSVRKRCCKVWRRVVPCVHKCTQAISLHQTWSPLCPQLLTKGTQQTATHAMQRPF